MVLPKLVGKSVRRKEDPRFITGRGRYLDDISLPGLLHARFVRSPYPHAKIGRIDSSGALKMQGVIAVLTGQDIAGLCRTGIPTAKLPPGSKLPRRFPLAMHEVNYVGEPVAILIAESKYLARDASDLIKVDYEPFEHVIDPEAALKEGSVRVHEELSDNVAYHSRRKNGNVERAFGESAKVLRQTFRIPRMAAIPLETRGIVASYDRGSEMLSIWIGTQGPHHIRTWYCEYLGLPQNRVRVVAPDMGGGFGCKLEIYSDELAVCIAALRLGRPVKWTQERMEDLMTTNHGRGQIHHVEVAVREDGRILGLRDRIVADYGAYLHIGTIITTQATEEMITGAYDIENVDIDVYGVFTNKMTHDAFRGAGVPEANYVIERMIDETARALGLDPAVVRMRNFVRPDQFPYTNATGTTYDNGDYEAGLRRALELVEYPRIRKEQQQEQHKEKKKKRKSQSKNYNGTRKLTGIGLASYVQIGGFGPSRDSADRVAGYESARVRVDPDGRVTLYSGSAPQGQGLETVLAQIVADELQVAMDDVTVIHGDTESVPYGIGTYGSRSAVVSGHSVLKACERIRAKSLRIAAQLFEARLDDIAFEEGKFYVKGSPSRALSLREIAAEATFMKNLPSENFEPVLDSTAHYDPERLTFAFGTHAAIVNVDTETGVVEVTKYVGVDDCGRVLNPMIVEGQMHGGIIQGLGEALYEEIKYDENGQLLTATLMDYTIPGVTESPEMILERTETPADSPLGLKGIGEAGTTVATPAISNAIADALSASRATIATLPARSEVVWSILRKKEG